MAAPDSINLAIADVYQSVPKDGQGNILRVSACATCRFRIGRNAPDWRCGAQAGVEAHLAWEKAALTQGDYSWCRYWRSKKRSRSLLRWMWDLLFTMERPK